MVICQQCRRVINRRDIYNKFLNVYRCSCGYMEFQHNKERAEIGWRPPPRPTMEEKRRYTRGIYGR